MFIAVRWLHLSRAKSDFSILGFAFQQYYKIHPVELMKITPVNFFCKSSANIEFFFTAATKTKPALTCGQRNGDPLARFFSGATISALNSRNFHLRFSSSISDLPVGGRAKKLKCFLILLPTVSSVSCRAR
jgi:hypothetical protein